MSDHQRTPYELPAVIFDVDLGKKLPEGAVIDYDRDALNSVLNHVEAPEDASDLDITIKSASHSLINGYYLGSDVIAIYKPKTIEDTLVHELQHYSDAANEHTSMVNRNKTLYRLGNLSMGVGTPLLLANHALNAGIYGLNAYSLHTTGERVIPHEVSDGLVNSSYGLAAFVLGTMPLYHFAEVERRARKSAKSYKGDPILTLDTQ